MRRRTAARSSLLLPALLLAVALSAPLLSNDRPLLLVDSGISFSALGELPLLGRLLERPEWRRRDWDGVQPGERWRVSAPILPGWLSGYRWSR